MTAITSIRANGLTKRYGRHRALASIDLELKSGSVCALLGPNGAGKSTLLGILSTLVKPTMGTVSYRSKGSQVESGVMLRGQIGVLAHEGFVYSQLSAIENLHFFGRLYGVSDIDTRVRNLLKQVGLEPSAWERAAQTYSRGMMQRLAVARALLPNPQVLLFDEPFTGLDHDGVKTLTEALSVAKQAGRLVLVVTHDLEPLGGLADHVVVLRRGHLAWDQRRPHAYSATELREIYAEYSATTTKLLAAVSG